MSIQRRYLRIVASALLCALVAPHTFADDAFEFDDCDHDAVMRRTDSHYMGPLPSTQNLPDISKIKIRGWQSLTPETDPYSGSESSGGLPHLVRIDVILSGVINPPGPLGLNGMAFDPFQFGNNPLYGFIEFDIDNDKDTGGDLTQGEAALHYLGNAARFGGRPAGSIGARAASSSGDFYWPVSHPPQIQLSGTDWIMGFCGCFSSLPVYKANPNEQTFGPGSTWIMEGRFFERASAYRGASLMIYGSQAGLYDPIVRVRFQHSIAQEETTVTLVYALDAIGASQLSGLPVQPYGTNVASGRSSISEGMYDLIVQASSGNIPPGSLAYEVTNRWGGRPIQTVQDLSRWKPSFIVGMSYPTYEQGNDGLYIWTDVGFNARKGDLNGDGVVDMLDRALVQATIEENDGSASDGDSSINGSVQIISFGSEFSLYDVNGDGLINGADLAFYNVPCAADFDHSGTLSTLDIFAFLNAWFDGNMRADFDHSGGLAVQDIFAFLGAWFAGC